MFFNGQKLPVAASRDHNNGWAGSIFDRVGIPMELAPPVCQVAGFIDGQGVIQDLIC